MTSNLFDPLTLGELSLPHRIAMAPMTRARTTQPGNVPNAMMADYYAQRAGAALIVSTAIWVRSLTGWLVLPAMGLAILAIARMASADQQRFAIQLLGVQAIISVWAQSAYLFTDSGTMGGQTMVSDTGAIADALLLPYWFWAIALSAANIALLWWSLRYAFPR